jgi:hypothetical protein
VAIRRLGARADYDGRLMSTRTSICLRVGLLLVLVGVGPWVALRLRRVAFFNNDFRDARAAYAGHAPGTRAVAALHVFRNTLPGRQEHAHACAPAGDADGDGCADLFLSSAASDGSGGGTVALRSGATGAVLRRWLLPARSHGPRDLRALGDRDGDGTSELLVVQGSLHGYGGTLAYVVDGASGRVLHEVLGAERRGGSTGALVVPLGDLDGDGLADLCVVQDGGTSVRSAADGALLQAPRCVGVRAVGALASDGTYPLALGAREWALADARSGALAARVALEALLQPSAAAAAAAPPPLVSGGGGSLPVLASVFGAPSVPPVERPALTFVADANGDGARDIALGIPWSGLGGEVWIQSARGETLARASADASGARYGAELLAWEGELLVGAPGEGALRLVRVADGSVLRTLRGETPGGGFGSGLANAGDVNGDGTDDVIVEEPSSSGLDAGGTPWRGTVWVLSGADLR